MDVKTAKENPASFPPWPVFGDTEIDAVENVLRSGRVNQWTGSEVTCFEKEYAEYVGMKYAVAVANGSVALDIALAILNIGPGDEVIVTPRSFVASAGCVALRGATPVFVDVDPDSQNVTPDAVKIAISSKTKALIAVHLAGWPCELDALRALCDEHGMYLIEDCAQAHGAKFKGKQVGSFGHIAAFSFCQDKIMTTGGEGGMLVTDDEDIWMKAWSYKDHGKDYESVFKTKHPPGFQWLVKSCGTNYRMTEMQAAIGRVALKRLNEWVQRRRMLAGILTEGLQEVPALRVTIPLDHIYHSYYKYYVFVRPEKLRSAWNRDRILTELEERGVPCGTGVCPEIYLEEAFKRCKYKLHASTYGVKDGRLPVAKELGTTSLMFMVHPTLTEENMEFVVKQVTEGMSHTSKK